LASRELLHRLMQKADVLNENFEPGTMGNVREKSGIDPVSLIAPARRLVERHRSLVAVDGQRNGGLGAAPGGLTWIMSSPMSLTFCAGGGDTRG